MVGLGFLFIKGNSIRTSPMPVNKPLKKSLISEAFTKLPIRNSLLIKISPIAGNSFVLFFILCLLESKVMKFSPLVKFYAICRRILGKKQKNCS